jgi:hypothetical protein
MYHPEGVTCRYQRMINASQPTSSTQAKDRLYAQLASSFARMSRAVSQTADLCEQLQVDLHAMRMLAALDAAKYVDVDILLLELRLDFGCALHRFMTIASELNSEGADRRTEEM